MRVWLRFVMACLLALALPAQGLANATMLHCGTSHQRMHTAQTAAPQDAAHHGHHDAAASQHSHSVGHADHANHDPLSNDTTDTPMSSVSPDKLTDLGQYKCSACASCCSGLALLGSMPRVSVPELGATVFLTVTPTVGAFATDGPDRPPRTSRV